jgi:hypothetical protein
LVIPSPGNIRYRRHKGTALSVEERERSFAAAREVLLDEAKLAEPERAAALRAQADAIECLSLQWEGFPALWIGLAPRLDDTDKGTEMQQSASGAELVAQRLPAEGSERLVALLDELAALIRSAGVDHALWRVAGEPPYRIRITRE